MAFVQEKAAAFLIGEEGLAALTDWVLIRGFTLVPLFYPINKQGTMIATKISNQAVYNILLKRGRAAQVSNFSPHDLRRTFVSDLLEAGYDPHINLGEPGFKPRSAESDRQLAHSGYSISSGTFFERRLISLSGRFWQSDYIKQTLFGY